MIRKWWKVIKFFYSLEIEPTVFADGLNVEHWKKKKGIKGIQRYSLDELENSINGKGLKEKYQLVLTAPLITFLFDMLIIDVVSLSGWAEDVVLAKMYISRIRKMKLVQIIFLIWLSPFSLRYHKPPRTHISICLVPLIIIWCFYADSPPPSKDHSWRVFLFKFTFYLLFQL